MFSESFVTTGRSNIVITCIENYISLTMDIFLFFQVELARPTGCRGLLTFLKDGSLFSY